MGMSDTMPNPTNWVQFYQQGQPQGSPQTTMFSDGRVSDATVVTTTATSIISTPDHHHGPSDGRVSKPIRRRSRASRRTPTTVLNTDTANFRAMVQQFTGGPIASQGTYLGFGSNNIHHQQIVNSVTTANSGAYNNNNIQFQQTLPQNQLPYMFSSLGTSSRPPSVVQGRADNFIHRATTLVSPSESGSSPSNENKSENNFMF
ncbi:VQ motif-containing protein 22-like [Lycium ferocissimum]|uniref:VQ motif-containing protein 22-like n=1 Tax=Lycium ferocissimum TaxID=112874 RepID=UPI0028162E03|nr:VQ motif-containing protein 22-like [Lycium ferocissimum]